MQIALLHNLANCFGTRHVNKYYVTECIAKIKCVKAKRKHILFVVCRCFDHLGFFFPISSTSLGAPEIWYVCVCVCPNSPPTHSSSPLLPLVCQCLQLCPLSDLMFLQTYSRLFILQDMEKHGWALHSVQIYGRALALIYCVLRTGPLWTASLVPCSLMTHHKWWVTLRGINHGINNLLILLIG